MQSLAHLGLQESLSGEFTASEWPFWGDSSCFILIFCCIVCCCLLFCGTIANESSSSSSTLYPGTSLPLNQTAFPGGKNQSDREISCWVRKGNSLQCLGLTVKTLSSEVFHSALQSSPHICLSCCSNYWLWGEDVKLSCLFMLYDLLQEHNTQLVRLSNAVHNKDLNEYWCPVRFVFSLLHKKYWYTSHIYIQTI